MTTSAPWSSECYVGRRRFDLRVAGHRLCAEWLEPAGQAIPGAPPLVFLHEGLGSIAQWVGRDREGNREGTPLDVPAMLVAATGCPALVYERLGFGQSDPLPAQRQPHYLYEEAWVSLPTVLDQTGIDRAILIGHSDGGSIALLFAARFPERTLGVVSEAAHVFVEDITLAGIRQAAASYHAPDSKLKAALQRYHGDKTEAMFRGWADVWQRPEFADFDMMADLAAITSPVLVIQGEDDEYGSPAQVTAIADGVSGPVDSWLVPDCGHVPHFQAIERVLPRMAAFIMTLWCSAPAGQPCRVARGSDERP
jgi:pimeloyl-ACP methyl ester carboxylesterase